MDSLKLAIVLTGRLVLLVISLNVCQLAGHEVRNRQLVLPCQFNLFVRSSGEVCQVYI